MTKFLKVPGTDDRSGLAVGIEENPLPGQGGEGGHGSPRDGPRFGHRLSRLKNQAAARVWVKAETEAAITATFICVLGVTLPCSTAKPRTTVQINSPMDITCRSTRSRLTRNLLLERLAWWLRLDALPPESEAPPTPYFAFFFTHP